MERKDVNDQAVCETFSSRKQSASRQTREDMGCPEGESIQQRTSQTRCTLMCCLPSYHQVTKTDP